jgi:oligoendopeptidase F
LNEDDRKKRSRLFRARNTIIDDKLTPILKQRVEKLHSIAREFGYRDYVWLFRDTKNINFQELSDSMTYFVERTESLYVDKMDEAMQKVIGVHLREAEKHDAAHVFRAKEYDSYFRKENALPVLENTLRGIGYSIKKYKNILIDVEERPRKLPRAFTSVIKVPGDVRLVVMPKGGQDDYTSMLHEAGHTMHYALVDPKSPVEYKRLGDASVTETYAFLLEYLTLNKTWLKENVGITEFDKYLDFAYLYKLYFLRRYAAKLKYELILHQGNEVDNMSEVYREKMEESLKFQHPEAHYLTDTDDGFYTSQYLRAWIFESQLRAYLVEKVGEAWF